MKGGSRKKHFDRGKWELERERCRIEDHAPPADEKAAVPVGKVISSLMKTIGLEEQQWFSNLRSEWENLVGEAVAKHTRPGRVAGKTLVVYVDSSVWLSELSRFASGAMVSSINRRFGAGRLSSVRLQIDPDGLRG